jgi:hypothetical protein
MRALRTQMSSSKNANESSKNARAWYHESSHMSLINDWELKECKRACTMYESSHMSSHESSRNEGSKKQNLMPAWELQITESSKNQCSATDWFKECKSLSSKSDDWELITELKECWELKECKMTESSKNESSKNAELKECKLIAQNANNS